MAAPRCREIVEHPFGSIKQWMYQGAFLMRGPTGFEPLASASESRTGSPHQDLAYLRFPGRMIGVDEAPPPDMLAFVAAQLGDDTKAFDDYAQRQQTRRTHSLTEALENNAQSVSGAIPNPDALAELAAKMQRAKNLALVVGSSIDRDGAFDLAVELAERSGATVWEAPAKSGAVYYC